MRGGGNDEIVSTGCGSPSVLHPWMLLLHMQETAFVDSPAGPLSSRGGAQISWHQSYTVQCRIFGNVFTTGILKLNLPEHTQSSFASLFLHFF